MKSTNVKGSKSTVFLDHFALNSQETAEKLAETLIMYTLKFVLDLMFTPTLSEIPRLRSEWRGKVWVDLEAMTLAMSSRATAQCHRHCEGERDLRILVLWRDTMHFVHTDPSYATKSDINLHLAIRLPEAWPLDTANIRWWNGKSVAGSIRRTTSSKVSSRRRIPDSHP